MHKKDRCKEEQHARADRHGGDLLGHAVELFLQRALLFFERLGQRCDLAELRLHTGCDDDGFCCAAGDAGARKHEVWHLGAAEPVPEDRLVRFAHGVGFTGERRLVHLKIAAFQQARVRGDLVAFREEHDIARHEVFRKDAVLHAVANHARIARQHVAQRFRGLARAVLLPEAEDAVDDVDEPDGDRQLHHVRKERDDAANPQKDCHQADEVCQKDENDRFSFLFGDDVLAVNPARVLNFLAG